MYIANQISLEGLALEFVPNAKVLTLGNRQIIFFSLHDVFNKQNEIQSFWRACNQYHLRPVAKTLFGKIRAVSISKD